MSLLTFRVTYSLTAREVRRSLSTLDTTKRRSEDKEYSIFAKKLTTLSWKEDQFRAREEREVSLTWKSRIVFIVVELKDSENLHDEE